MKAYILTAEKSLRTKARASAKACKTTLNQLLRDWLASQLAKTEREAKLADLEGRLNYV